MLLLELKEYLLEPSVLSLLRLEYLDVLFSLLRLVYLDVLFSLLRLEYLDVLFSLFRLEYFDVLFSLLRLEYFEVLDSLLLSLLMPEYLDVLDSLLRLEYLLAGASELSLQLPYLVVVSVSLLNASLQLVRPPPDSNLEPPPSYLAEAAWAGPASELAVLTGRLEYLGREEAESEEARLVLQLGPELAAPYFPPPELSGVVPLL